MNHLIYKHLKVFAKLGTCPLGLWGSTIFCGVSIQREAAGLAAAGPGGRTHLHPTATSPADAPKWPGQPSQGSHKTYKAPRTVPRALGRESLFLTPSWREPFSWIIEPAHHSLALGPSGQAGGSCGFGLAPHAKHGWQRVGRWLPLCCRECPVPGVRRHTHCPRETCMRV